MRRLTSRSIKLAPLALAASLALASVSASAATRTFSGPGSFWDGVANWTGGILPGAGDDAALGAFDTEVRTSFSVLSVAGTGRLTFSGGANLTLAAASSIGALTFNAGTVAGAGSLVVSGASNWAGGTMTGTGTTTFNGDLALGGASSVRDVTGGRTVVFGGTTTWTNTFNSGGRFRTGGGSTLRNAGTFNDNTAFDTQFSNDFSGAASSFVNAGTYNKGGAGTTTVGVVFNNARSAPGTGVVVVNAGGLLFNGGGTANSGATFTTAVGSVLGFGGYTLEAGSSVVAAGVVRFNTGTNTVAGSFQTSAGLEFVGGTTTFTGTVSGVGSTVTTTGGTANFNNTQAFSVSALNIGSSGTLNFNNAGGVTTTQLILTAGTLGGGSNVVVSGNDSSWTGGAMTGTGTTTFSGDLALGGASSVRDVTGGRTVVFGGTTTWTNTFNSGGRFRTGGGSTLRNTGTFNDNTAFDTQFSNDFSGAASSFVNAGTYNKGGAGTTSTGSSVNVSNLAGATLNLNAGVFSLQGGDFDNAGTVNLAAGTTLIVGAGTTTLGGTVVAAAGSTVRVTGGTLRNTVARTLTGQLDVRGGTATMTEALSVGTLAQSGGTINGAQNLTVSGASSWAGGTMSDVGTTTFSGDLALGGASSVRDVTGGRTVVFGGITTWTNTFNSGGRFRTGGGSTLRNAGTFNDNTAFDTQFSNDFSGAASSFVNAGTYNKGGAGTTSVFITFTNQGSTDVTAGTLTLAGAAGSFTNFSGTTLTGGSIAVRGNSTMRFTGANIVTNASRIVLDGAGSALLNHTNGSNALANFATNAAAGEFTLLNGRNFTTAGAFANSGVVNVGSGSAFTASGVLSNNATGAVVLAGGSLGAASTTNAGTLRGQGNVTGSVANSGAIVAQGGTLGLAAAVSGAGSITLDPAASLSLAVASSTGTLSHNGSLLTLGEDLTVSSDYVNAGFGTGNSFNRRAGLAGPGQLLGSNVSWALTGAAAANGANAWVLDFGTVRGGTTRTLDFQVANTGTGASLRGALQNGGPGQGNISDARLSGSGVVAGNFGAVLAGGNQAWSVTLDATGTGGNLAGQSIALVGNFDNLATQTVALTGQTTVLAQGGLTPTGPLDLGNFRVGRPPVASTTLTASNLTAGAGAESLAIASAGASGNYSAGNLLGSGLVAPGASAADAVRVSSSGGVAGANNGSLTVQFASNGQAFDASFGNLNTNTRVVSLVSRGYEVAQPSLPTAAVNVGNFRVTTGASSSFTVVNTNIAPSGFQELLNIELAGTSAGVVFAGSIAGLAPGASSNAMNVGFAAGGSGGVRNGSATLALASDGAGTSGLGVLSLGSGNVAVTGTAFNIAVGQAQPSPVTVANQRLNGVGGGAASTALTVRNLAPSGVFSEALNASFSAVSGAALNNGGNVSDLAAGASNSSAMAVTVNNTVAGARSGSVTLAWQTDGSGANGNSGLSAVGAGSQTLDVAGNVYRLASASVVAPAGPIVLANQRVGGVLSQTLSLTNTAVADGFSEALNAAASASGTAVARGSFTMLAAGATSNTLRAGVDTSSAGAKSGTVTLALASDGAGSSGFSAFGIGQQQVQVSGNVFRLAVPQVDTTPIVLAARVGAAAPSATVLVRNLGPDAFTEHLNAGWAATPAGISGSGNVSGLVQGQSSTALSLSLATTTAGTFQGNAQVSLVSSGVGTTGAADASLGTATVSVTGRVWAAAQASASSSVNFGIVRVGDTNVQRTVAVSNTNSGALTDTLNATLGASGAPFSSSGSVVGLASGQTDNSSLVVSLNTAVAGQFTGNASLGLETANSDLGAEALAGSNVALSATVNNLADSALMMLGGNGTLGGGGLVSADTRRYTLTFADIVQGSGNSVALLSLANPVAAPGDTLLGGWNLAGLSGGGFAAAGFGSVSLLPGQANSLQVSLLDSAVGRFDKTIVLNAVSFNGFGADIQLSSVELRLVGNVAAIPEPGTYALMALGLLAVVGVARKRRQAQPLAA